ncbi:hypothetical protein BH23GEM6_BH23GEM6_15110 [soil metagenome]
MLTSGRSRLRRTVRPPKLQPERAALNTPKSSASLQPRSRPAHGRILGWSIVVSVALHLLILVLSPIFLRIGEPPGLASVDRDRFSQRAVQIIDPVTRERADQRAPAESADVEGLPLARSGSEEGSRAVVPRGARQAPRESELSPPRPGAAESAREGLRTGPRDPRLWVNPRDVPLPEQSDRERYQVHIQARIDAMNDSIRGDAERARRATDWTVTDKEGRRWGLSPEGLHLGGVTVPPQLVPRPAATGDNQSQERQREEQRQRDEIRRQEEARERRRTGGGGS